MSTLWILIWFSVSPEQGVRYYTVGTYDNETMCRSALKEASVIVNDKQETIDCIGVTIR